MTSQSCSQKARAGAVAIAVIGTFLVMFVLVRLMQSYTEAPSSDEVRGAERMQFLTEMKAASKPLLETYDWQDQAKGIVRVPIERAEELVLQEWQDPETARSNMMARAEKAFALPPVAPPPKNKYE